jgi:hypothetical protein
MKVKITHSKIKINIKAHDVANMDKTLAMIIYQMLLKYRDDFINEYSGCSLNVGKKFVLCDDIVDKVYEGISKAHWLEILGCMIQCFMLLSQEENYHDQRDSMIITKGLTLFAQYYQQLFI